mmetsp:Transcript_26257/g.62394  ORF Transcript_26257/g.62394 Transcript_26257/m.62394 type:complete len:315 (+) Transcript_26257:264-1208(+)
MTAFHGFCSAPHGGWAILGLIVASCCGLSASMWGIASCRFMFVDYETDRGVSTEINGFNFFLDPTADLNEPVEQRVGAGLFSWLFPNEDATTWSDGRCAGYNQSQREHFGDEIFEVSRIFAVLTVLSGMGMTLWIVFLLCISLNRIQIWLMRFVLGLLPVFSGLTFIIFYSTLCTDLVSYQDETYETNCTIDQGGLVVIAGAIFWTIAFLISLVYIKPPESDLRIQNGKITNAFNARQEERFRREQQQRQKRKSNQGHRGRASGRAGRSSAASIKSNLSAPTPQPLPPPRLTSVSRSPHGIEIAMASSSTVADF